MGLQPNETSQFKSMRSQPTPHQLQFQSAAITRALFLTLGMCLVGVKAPMDKTAMGQTQTALHRVSQVALEMAGLQFQ
jgi:hypothetical protein